MMNSYQQDGYLLVKQAIPLHDLQPFQACIVRQVDAHAQALLAEGKITSLHKDAPFGKRLAALHANNELRMRSWDAPVFGPELHALIQHPAIAAALEPQLGPHISFNGDYHLRPKMPDSELTAFPLHQDSQYYGKPSQHAHIITVWVPLVDVDERNGCLYVIPGSNRWELFESARDVNQNMRSFVDVEARGTPIPVPMQLGDILLFSNMTFHGSKVNRTDAVRWSIDIRYCRTRGTYTATALEQAGEDFMYDKLKKSGRLPMVVRGEGPHWSFAQWEAALARE
ncbi:MAG TPA: phytanoyl-CoA dioxygenase family protein [Caldilineaceae bacterium]|nr:phytanoyl-CoA dioxygenase family protein [Caldilineaceae bacterium]